MIKLFNFSGGIAPATGAARGLGCSIAKAMAARGAAVIVSSENVK